MQGERPWELAGPDVREMCRELIPAGVPGKDRGSYGADIAISVTQSCYRPVDPAGKCHQNGASRRALPRFPADDPRSRHRTGPATAREADVSASGLPHRCGCCLARSLRSFAPACGWSKERTRPRSVVAVAETPETGRLRSAAGSRWRLRPDRVPSVGAARRGCPPAPGDRTLTSIPRIASAGFWRGPSRRAHSSRRAPRADSSASAAAASMVIACRSALARAAVSPSRDRAGQTASA